MCCLSAGQIFSSLIQTLTVSWYLTTQGSIYMTLAVREPCDGQFLAPIGLAIDKFNRLIVCDAGSSSREFF